MVNPLLGFSFLYLVEWGRGVLLRRGHMGYAADAVAGLIFWELRKKQSSLQWLAVLFYLGRNPLMKWCHEAAWAMGMENQYYQLKLLIPLILRRKRKYN